MSDDSFLPHRDRAERSELASVALAREVVMSVPASRNRKRLLCRFNLHHKWVRRKNAEGEDYLQCKACGKDLYDVERHDPDISGGFAAGGGGFS
jgi:hypothetical protein